MIDTVQLYDLLHSHFYGRVRRNEPLSDHCSFGVGGPADLWLTITDEQELETLVRFCTTHKCPLLLVGAGRNVMFSDAGVRGIVARLDMAHYYIEPLSEDRALLEVEAGMRWQDMLQQLQLRGWGGLEFGAGIPGTLGAGIVSNAGAHNRALGDFLEWIEVLDARGCNTENYEVFVPLVKRRYYRDELDLGYRHSRFRVNRTTHFDELGRIIIPERHLIEPAEIILKLGLRLERKTPEQLQVQNTEYMQKRHADEPALPRTGPVFKDPPGAMAKDLIAQAGLAGKILGKAQISEQNANYVVNLGGAKATELVALIREAHQKVRELSGVNLAMNLELLGDWVARDSHH